MRFYSNTEIIIKNAFESDICKMTTVNILHIDVEQSGQKDLEAKGTEGKNWKS